MFDVLVLANFAILRIDFDLSERVCATFPNFLEHDDKSNLKLEVVDRKFRGTNFIYTLKTSSDLLIPVFVHSHHVHQHEIDEKFGIKRPINIDHIVCF